jgi:glycosyltransferase involved in cell wall biosynthesis
VRVLHVHSGNLYGGIETLLTTLARQRHVCPDMTPEYALCYEGRLSEELRAAGVPVHRLGPARTRRPGAILRARRRLRRIAEERRVDVELFHSPWSLALLGGNGRDGRSLAFWLHGPTSGSHWLERWARRRRPDVVLSNSRHTRRSLERLFPGARAEVVYLPLEPTPTPEGGERSRVRAEAATTEDAVVIAHVGRVELGKGHRVLLEALGLLRRREGWVCWFVGGAQRSREASVLTALRRRAAELGIEGRLRFLGERRDVARVLAGADVYCQPNLSPEGFGFSLIEALHAGLPVVTSAIGSAAELLDESCAVLVPPGEPAAVAAALERLLDSPGTRLGMASQARERARAVSDPSTQLPRLRDVLSETASRARCSR